MTPADYKTAREAVGTQSEVADLLGISRPTISRRETHGGRITEEAAIAILHLAPKQPKTARTRKGLELPAQSCSPCWDRGYNFETWLECEEATCGGMLHISDNCDGLIYDGDEYECPDCGATGSMMLFGGEGEQIEVAAIPSEEHK